MSKRGAGEGSIYEESPGKWVASITAGYEFKKGKRVRIRKKFSAATRGAVKENLTDALKLQQDGYSVAPQNQTVGHFLNYWLNRVVPNNTKPKTATFYRYIVTQHLIPSIGQIQIQKLNAHHVQALINEKLGSTKQPRRKKPATKGLSADAASAEPRKLSERSVRHIHRTLCTALETAVKYGTVQRNVANLIDPPRIPRGNMKFLTLDQARAVLTAAAEDPLYALYATILSLGLRLGEALALSWDDIDFAKARIRVRRTLQRVNGEMQLLDPKTADSIRTIDLPAVTLAALSAHRKGIENTREWAGSRWKGNDWNLVFTTSVGTPLV